MPTISPKTLPPEQKAALLAYARRRGRFWKRELLAASRAAIKDGTRIVLAEPLPFKGGLSAQEFVATTIVKCGRRQRLFRDVASGMLCQLSPRHFDGATLS